MRALVAVAACAFFLSGCMPMLYAARCMASRTHDFQTVTYAKADDAASDAVITATFDAVRAASVEMTSVEKIGPWWPKKDTFFEAKNGKIEIDFGFDTAAGYYAVVIADTKTGQITVDVSYVGPNCESGDPKPAAVAFTQKIASELKPRPTAKKKR